MTAVPRVTLILGGQRSGKSAEAERRVAARAGARVYLATAQAHDAEMAARIEAHKARRDAGWSTVEEPLELTRALAGAAGPERCVLVDCLTLWLSNLLAAGRDPDAAAAELAEGLGRLDGPVVLVSNEVGQGVIPANALARQFVDAAGRLHQRVAAVADEVVFMAAGLPLTLKSPATQDATAQDA